MTVLIRMKNSRSEKRISLPAFMTGASTLKSNNNNNNSGEIVRDISQNLIRTTFLRKLKTMRKKWFVLYGDDPENPENQAHLEYHDDEKKWRAASPPKRNIILSKCLNICRKQDSRDSKHKLVIALYTLDDCVSLLFDFEEELKVWLDLLLSHQQGGRNVDGRIPKPNYEHMWQVKVRGFTPFKSSNFIMNGAHRLCVTSQDVKFFPLGSGDPVVFPVNCIRGCGTKDRIFKLETGGSSISGSGLLIIECEDKEISTNLNVRVLECMRESNSLHDLGTFKKRPSYCHPGSSGVSSSRPRSESWSNPDKSSLLNSSTSRNSTLSALNTSSVISSLNARYRTISEGAHFELHKLHKRPNHLSSSPGSFLCSSESAGSSNSIEEMDDSKFHSSDGIPGEPIIYEESSAESWVDPEMIRSKVGIWNSTVKCHSVVSLVNGSLEPPSESLSHEDEYMDMSSETYIQSPVPISSSGSGYMAMSPIGSGFFRSNDSHVEEVHKDNYVTMSPVSVDTDKLKCIYEEWTRDGDNISHALFESDIPDDPSSNYVPLDFSCLPSSSSLASPSSMEFLHPDKSVSYILRGDEDVTDYGPSVSLDKIFGSNSEILPALPTKRSASTKPFSDSLSTRGGSSLTNNNNNSNNNNNNSSSSSNIVSKLDSWFRSRTGSVPTRPPFLTRRRHRTRSEGEKENSKTSSTTSSFSVL